MALPVHGPRLHSDRPRTDYERTRSTEHARDTRSFDEIIREDTPPIPRTRAPVTDCKRQSKPGDVWKQMLARCLLDDAFTGCFLPQRDSSHGFEAAQSVSHVRLQVVALGPFVPGVEDHQAVLPLLG